MDFLKLLKGDIPMMVLSMALIKVGNKFKKKDANSSGKDDVFGDFCIAAAPVVASFDEDDDPNDTTFKKGLRKVRDVINNYLGE